MAVFTGTDTIRREYPIQPVVGVAGVVFNDRNEVLLIRRAREPAKGVWSLPGGVLELGEFLEDAVIREILEETGIPAEPIQLITVVERVLHDESQRVRYHYVIAEYLCRAPGSDPQASDDVDRAVWVSMDEIDRYALPELTMRIIGSGWQAFRTQPDPRAT